MAANAGAVHVLFGSAGGLTSVDDLWLQGDSGANGSVASGDRSGDELAVGDFNRDGCDDLVVASPSEDFDGAPDSGNGYVIEGGPGGLSPELGWTVLRPALEHVVSPQEQFGTRLWVRDANADRYPDLVVMTPGDPCECRTQRLPPISRRGGVTGCRGRYLVVP